MEISIIEDKENIFFKRRDLKLRIRHIGNPTPSKNDIIKELALKYDVDNSQVIIEYVFSQSGLGESFVKCNILQEKPKEEKKPEETKGAISETQNSATA